MASIEKFVQNKLLTVSGLGTGHVAAVEEMRGISPPFAVFTRQTWDEEKALDGYTGLQSAGFDLDVVAPTLADVVTLEGRIRTAFRGAEGTAADGLLIEAVELTQVSPDLREVNIGQFRRAYDLQINYQEVASNE